MHYLCLKYQYDGYHFSDNLTDIYNPFSLLNAFAVQRVDDYLPRQGRSAIGLWSNKVERLE